MDDFSLIRVDIKSMKDSNDKMIKMLERVIDAHEKRFRRIERKQFITICFLALLYLIVIASILKGGV